ncbi:MAG: PIG-L deacetylase family protein [Microbacteriaceae bacterium]
MATLEPFTPDNINRVLCIVAHPDDMEYGDSAAVAEWAAQGIEVSYLLLTEGEAGIRGMEPAKVGPMRAAEQHEACKIVGVTTLEILNLPDGLLEANLETRRAIARAIRKHRPDAVMTMTWSLEAPWGLNHADHRATGIATVDAIRDADNPWIFPELIEDEGLEAWKATWLLAMSHDASHAVVVSEESKELAIRSLEAHAEYLAALPDHPAPRDLITGILAQGGESAGTAHALPIRPYRM